MGCPHQPSNNLSDFGVYFILSHGAYTYMEKVMIFQRRDDICNVFKCREVKEILKILRLIISV